MSFFWVGNKAVKIEGFQSHRITPPAENPSGFDIAYLSRWPYVLGPQSVQVPQEVIEYFNQNQKLFCRDNLELNKGWSYYPLYGPLEYLFLDNEEISFKKKHAKIKYNESVSTIWPQLPNLIESLPFDAVSAAVFALQPKSNICVHIDKKRYGLDKLLIPLNKPKDAFFAFYHYGAVPLESGKVYAIDASYHHYAANQSDEIRYHLIIRGSIEERLNEYFDWLKRGFSMNGPPVFEKIPEDLIWAPANYVESMKI